MEYIIRRTFKILVLVWFELIFQRSELMKLRERGWRMDGISLIGFGLEYQNVLYWIGFVVWMEFGNGWNV